MIDLDKDIIPIFPTGIFKIEIPNTFSNIINFFNQEKMHGENVDYGLVSKNTYLLNQEKYQDFRNFILEKCFLYGTHVLGFDYPEYIITQSWLTHKPPNTQHVLHIHPNSIISGVLFYGKVNQETPKLTFKKGLAEDIDIPIYRISLKRNEILNTYTANQIHVDCIPGTLLLFPSWLKHTVSYNKTDLVRKSLAFNAIPKKGLGDPNELTELKL